MDPLERALVTWRRAQAAAVEGDLPRARDLLAHVAAEFSRRGQKPLAARALLDLALLCREAGDSERAEEAFRKALDAIREGPLGGGVRVAAERLTDQLERGEDPSSAVAALRTLLPGVDS